MTLLCVMFNEHKVEEWTIEAPRLNGIDMGVGLIEGKEEYKRNTGLMIDSML